MHTRSSSEIQSPFIKGQIVIRTEDTIDKLSAKISNSLFSDVSFSGREENIYDEVPAVYLDMLGLRFVLSGFQGKHYVLECYPSPPLPEFPEPVQRVDISKHLLCSIGYIEGASIDLK